MATYKLIQDIEAEDKLALGMTFRQFVYFMVAGLLFYINAICFMKGIAFFDIIFLPPALFFLFFALPFGRDQSTEVWALAKVRFYFKPRRRIWDQSGAKELVTVTAPKKVERVLTDGLSHDEVRSRLSALANTIDSRGWAIKNVNVSMYGQQNPLMAMSSDRLIDPNSMPQDVPSYDVSASDDMLDENSNPIAQQFTQMINASEQSRRQQLINQMNSVTPLMTPQQTAQQTQAADYWFLNQSAQPAKADPSQATFTPSPVIAPGTTTVAPAEPDTTASEAAAAAALRASHDQEINVMNSHLKTIQPLSHQTTASQVAAQPHLNEPTFNPFSLPLDNLIPDAPQAATSQPIEPPKPVETKPDLSESAKMYAGRDDLTIDTIARQAKQLQDENDGEVVISLH